MSNAERGPSWVLDAAVSEKIFGSARIDPYSTEMPFAWELLQEMQQRGCSINLYYDPDKTTWRWECRIWKDSDGLHGRCHRGFAVAMTLPEAICLAVLDATAQPARAPADRPEGE